MKIDEGGTMNDEVKDKLLSLHRSSFLLHSFPQGVAER
jgi:hypothetical protein